MRRGSCLAAAAAIGAVAFGCYRATLLPGLDFGDSASFQTVVGSLTLTPRQAYPLYYALGNLFAWLDRAEPAHAMNLASAVYGALAAAVATLVAVELTASLLAGITAGLLLSFSYTFWSQAITAEVYTLHILIVGCCLLALFAWERRQTFGRLALFYAIYALGFGNHLSMVLLLPGFVLFLLMRRTPGPGDPLSTRGISAAVAIALLGALQYTWNLAGLWTSTQPPEGLGDALAKFWFDVTKADWRETIVMGLSEQGLESRPAMYWWDLQQQFGLPGIALAVVGIAYLAFRSRSRALLIVALYATNLAFAWTYNVGDAYIFFLPAHYFVALCAAAGTAALASWPSALRPLPSALRPLPSALRPIVGLAVLSFCLWRGYDNFPALDRSWDTRATRVLDDMTAPVDSGTFCSDPIFALDANWQIQNAAEYYMREHKPGTAWFVTEELEWLSSDHQGAFDRLVADNYISLPRMAARHIVLSSDAANNIKRGGGSKFAFHEITSAPALASELAALPNGLVYALAVLRPYRELPIDRTELDAAWRVLAGDAPLPAFDDFSIVIGRIGESPLVTRTGRSPFRARTAIGTSTVDVRMESWLPTDTIRRSGFGHVIVDRQHVLALDRGISLVVLGSPGPPVFTAYRAGLFAPVRRLVPITSDYLFPCYR